MLSPRLKRNAKKKAVKIRYHMSLQSCGKLVPICPRRHVVLDGIGGSHLADLKIRCVEMIMAFYLGSGA